MPVPSVALFVFSLSPSLPLPSHLLHVCLCVCMHVCIYFFFFMSHLSKLQTFERVVSYLSLEAAQGSPDHAVWNE